MMGDFSLGANHLSWAAAFYDALPCGPGGTDRSPADLCSEGFHADSMCDGGGTPNIAFDPRPEPAGDRRT
jgi:hypothetical protein